VYRENACTYYHPEKTRALIGEIRGFTLFYDLCGPLGSEKDPGKKREPVDSGFREIRFEDAARDRERD